MQHKTDDRHDRRTDTVIVGAGQAGLALSRHLTDAGIDHVLLERGRLAERWRSERWDSLRLLTPNWQSRLPGWSYRGDDPDGFMTMPEVVTNFERYAESFDAPVSEHTTVLSVDVTPDGDFVVGTDRGIWHATNVVIATGHADVPRIPSMADGLPADVHQLVPTAYRNPDQLPPGGVLVVGASASGVQIADELQRAGRQVTIAVGRHTRLPRRYRGRDIQRWLDELGMLDVDIDDVPDAEAARRQPSLQIVGSPDGRCVDLPALERRGVRLAGRVVGIDGARVEFADDLRATTDHADLKLARLLDRIDAYIARSGLADEVGASERLDAVDVSAAITDLDLDVDGVGTVIWATGFRRSYPWLKVPVLDEAGEIRQHRGVTPQAGLFTLGLQFQCRRKSSFIDGVGDDAAEIAAHIVERATPDVELPRLESIDPTLVPEPGADMPITPISDAPDYDVIVVGGRAAGAATAMLAARQGLRVLVLERAGRLADTLSTHAIMRPGVVQLARWGLLDAIRADGAPTIGNVVFHYGDTEFDLPVSERDGIDGLYAPRRTSLDPIIADAAVAAGADVRYGVRVTDVVRGVDGRVSGVEAVDADDRAVTFSARWVVGADGKGSKIARLVDAPVTATADGRAATVLGYFRGADLDHAAFHWLYGLTDAGDGVTGGLIPTNDDTHCVFVSTGPRRFGDIDTEFVEQLDLLAPDAVAALAASEPVGRLRSFPGLNGFLRQAWGPGWALVGDAGYFKDPATAHGLTDAFRDAELLAHALVEAAAGTAEAEAFGSYESVRDELSVDMLHIAAELGAHRWDLARVGELHLAASASMQQESDVLDTLATGTPARVPVAA